MPAERYRLGEGACRQQAQTQTQHTVYSTKGLMESEYNVNPMFGRLWGPKYPFHQLAAEAVQPHLALVPSHRKLPTTRLLPCTSRASGKLGLAAIRNIAHSASSPVRRWDAKITGSLRSGVSVSQQTSPPLSCQGYIVPTHRAESHVWFQL